MWDLDYKESWVLKLKNWCFWTVLLEKTLESPLDCKEIQSVHPKGNQSWMFIGRTDAEAETPVLWPPDTKNDSLEKTLMLGKIEGRRRRGRQRMRSLGGITYLMDRSLSKLWNWWWTGRPGVLQSMGHKELDTPEQLNWTEGRKRLKFQPIHPLLPPLAASLPTAFSTPHAVLLSSQILPAAAWSSCLSFLFGYWLFPLISGSSLRVGAFSSSLRNSSPGN